MSHLNCKWWKK